MSQIGIRFYGESRENFNRLEIATRCDGKLTRIVELVDAQGFKGNDTVEQIFVKVSTRPRPTPTRELTSLEMLGELFQIFGYFPSITPGLPTAQIDRAVAQLKKIHALPTQIFARDIHDPQPNAVEKLHEIRKRVEEVILLLGKTLD